MVISLYIKYWDKFLVYIKCLIDVCKYFLKVRVKEKFGINGKKKYIGDWRIVLRVIIDL